MKINATKYPTNDTFKFLRQALNVTQEQLEKDTGIKVSSIQKYESGRQDYPFTALIKIAKAYNLNIIIETTDKTVIDNK